MLGPVGINERTGWVTLTISARVMGDGRILWRQEVFVMTGYVWNVMVNAVKCGYHKELYLWRVSPYHGLASVLTAVPDMAGVLGLSPVAAVEGVV